MVLEQTRTIHLLSAEAVGMRKTIDKMRDEMSYLEHGDTAIQFAELKFQLAQARAHAMTNEHVAKDHFAQQQAWNDQMARAGDRWQKAADQIHSLQSEVLALRLQLAERDAQIADMRFSAALAGGEA